MKNAAYWAKRFEGIENIEHDTALASTADIQGLLAGACKKIDQEIMSFYLKYAEQSGMTYAGAQLYLQRNEVQAFKADLKDYTNMAMNNSDGQFEDVLNALSSRVHIQRLEALKIRTAMRVREVYGQADATLSQMCQTIMQDAHMRTAYEIQHGIGKYEPFHQIDKKSLARAVSKPWTADGQTFSDRIWTHQQQLTANLQRQFTQGFISGIDPKEMTKQITDMFGIAERSASRLVRTEGAFFAAAGDQSAYGELGIDKYQILVTLDDRTCEICSSYDGQVFDMKDYDVGDTTPPFHACCRCTTLPVIADSVLSTEEKRAARGDNGKTIMVDGGLTYSRWKDTYGEKGDDA